MRLTSLGLFAFFTALAACGKDAPTVSGAPSAVDSRGPDLRYSAGYVGNFIECVVTVRNSSPSTDCTSSSQSLASRAARGAVFTQQEDIVNLEAREPTYDAKHGWFKVQVRVHNHSYYSIGTVDGTNPSSWKTSVVLLEPPRVLVGSGTASVAAPTLRVSAHPSLPRNTLYRSYPGITRGYQKTDWGDWDFKLSSGVRQFVFRVVIVADMEALVKISEVNPGLRGPTSSSPSAGVILEMDNVGSAAITNTTLFIVDSIVGSRSVVYAKMPITDDWPKRGRRIVASADLRSVLFTPIYGLFPSKYVFDNTKSHRIRVRVGSLKGRVLDELQIDANTIRLAGFGFEREYRDYQYTVTRLNDAWHASTTQVRTQCAGAPTCPVLTGSPGE